MNFPYSVLKENKVFFEFQERSHNGVTLFHPVWRNPGPKSIEAADMTPCWQLPSKELNPYVIVKNDCSKHNERYDLRALHSPLPFNGFIILRSTEGKFILFGIVTLKKNGFQWAITENTLTLTLFADGRPLYPGEIWEGDHYCCIQADTLYELQKKYAELIAEMNPRKRELQTTVWRGWGSWDYYADHFTEQQLWENFKVCRELYPEANLLQVDDGYCIWGDWLNVKKDYFPEGMASFVKKVRAKNAHAGIWMPPFLASYNSELFKQHPGWFLYRPDGSLEVVVTSIPLVLPDYSQPEVCDWWRNVLHTARREWGFEYFKLDFLSHGLNPCRGKYPMTSAERFQKCFDIVEEEFGNDTFLLGCSTCFAPTFGRVDANRVGPDISPNFGQVTDSGFGNISNVYLNRVFRCDGDYLVVRHGEADQKPELAPPKHKVGTLTSDEAKLWCDIVSMLNGTILESDNLPYLRPERRKLAADTLAKVPADEVFPLDLFSGDGTLPPSVCLIRRGSQLELACFNWSEKEKTLVLCEGEGKEYFKVTLKPHSSHVEKLQETRSFEELAKILVSTEKEMMPPSFPVYACEPFQLTGSFQPVPLGKAATLTIDLDRIHGCLVSGHFAPVTEQKELCGIPFDFNCSGRRVIGQPASNAEGFSVDVNSKVKALYLIQGASMVLKNEFLEYSFIYDDGTKAAVKQIIGEDFGNYELPWSMPWKGTKGHIGWYNPATHSVLFVTELVNPHPEKQLLRIESSPLKQNGTLYVAGITALK